MSLRGEWKEYSLRFDEGDLKLLKQVEGGRFEPREAYQQNLLAHQASLIQEFEELICLPTLRNVEHYPYQIEAARKVLRRFKGRALLSDEVGLGKTIEAGIVLKEYVMRGLVRRVLILTPPGLVEQWKEEMEAKFDLSFMIHEDPEFKALGEKAWGHFPLVIASLPTAKAADHASIIQGIRYDLVIVDEAHHLKSRSTVNWQFVNALDKKFILLLTATPLQNDLEELFNLVTILKPGQLKTLRQFKREFVTRGERRRPKNIQRLRELLGECMIRNGRSQVEQRLPPRSAHTIRLKPTPEQKALYEAVSDFVRELHPQVGYQARGINRLVLQTMQMEAGSSARALLPTVEKLLLGGRIPQAARGRLEEIRAMAATITESTKAEAAATLIEAAGEKVIVFTKYRETQESLKGIFAKRGYPFSLYHGGLSRAEKDKAIAAFEGEAQVLLSTEAGGEGRNLQFCRIMLNYDLPWNPMRIEQRVGRIHRIGQPQEVHIYNLAAEETIEAYLLKLLDEKINMFELVLGEMDMILGNLEDERDFAEIVMEIWVKARGKEELEAGMEELGRRLISAREEYLETRAYDEALFGEDFGTV